MASVFLDYGATEAPVREVDCKGPTSHTFGHHNSRDQTTMPTYDPPLFVTLPEDTELLWDRVAQFLAVWREPLDATSGISTDELEKIQSALEIKFPAVLRECYSILGNRLAGSGGYLGDEVNAFYAPGSCRIESEYFGGLEHPILVIADGYWGGLWGVRLTYIEQEDPPISFVDSSAVESRLYRLSEFLIGMLAILAAPICLRVEKERLAARHELTDRIHEEFKAR